MLDHVRSLMSAGKLDALWEWCMKPDGPHGKAKRFGAAAYVARQKRDHEKKGTEEYKTWESRRNTYDKERDKWEKRHQNKLDKSRWPDSMRIAECLYHFPGPHFHLASPERDKLIVVGHILHDEGKLRIGEFPPFDAVEGVHVGISWHYRDPSRPFVGLTYEQAAGHLGLGGSYGCALDGNDLDNGNDDDYAAYIEVKRRFGVGSDLT